MNIKKIIRIIICSVLIFQILISSISNAYAIAPAIPIYLADAIAQVAIANGVRLGEENKGDIAGELYNNMTPEQREILRRDCLIYVDSLTFSPLAYYQMSKPCFEMLSKEISEYFNDKIADGTYSIETEEVAPSYGETVYIKASDTQTFLDTINATLPEGCNKVTASSSLLSYYRDYLSKYSDIYVGYCSAMTNVTSSNLNNVSRYPGFYVCGGDPDTFLSTLEVFEAGEGYKYNSSIKVYTTFGSLGFNYSDSYDNGMRDKYFAYGLYSRGSSSYGFGPCTERSTYPIDVETLGLTPYLHISVLDDDFVGPLPTGNDFIKKLKLADGTSVALEKNNAIENESYIDDMLVELETEDKIKTTATGEKEVLLKSSEALSETDKPLDVFEDPYKDLTGHEERAITDEKPVAVEEPVLDTTLDTTDIFTTVKSFFLNFWTNLKTIFSNLWNWLKRIYTAITSIGTKLATFDLSILFKKYFVPDFTSAYQLKNIFLKKFGVISQLESLYMGFFNFSGDRPKFEITYLGVTGEIINFDMYDDNKEYIDAFIIAIAYFMLIRKIIKKIPSMIGGI